MLLATIILILLACFLSIRALCKGKSVFKDGMNRSKQAFVEQFLLVIFAFILAGFLEVNLPQEIVKNYLGQEAGVLGVLLGTIMGFLMISGPYIIFPIIITIYSAGAGTATILAMTTAYMLLSMSKTTYELALLGSAFFIKRFLLTFIFPVLVGLLALAFGI